MIKVVRAVMILAIDLTIMTERRRIIVKKYIDDDSDNGSNNTNDSITTRQF